MVIGLGQVGWRFDEEPGRTSVWTHVGAYKALGERYEITGAFDADAATRAAFAKRHPDVNVASSLSALVESTEADVVSICTPAASHHSVLERVLSATPRVVWCEKPLSTSLANADAMVRACDAGGVNLLVSHVRRWSPVWRRFKERLDGGEIGALRSLRVVMPNRLWSVGSHAVDLLLWLGGAVTDIVPMFIPALEEEDEPAVAALLAFGCGAAGYLQVAGPKSNLIVEAEAIGDKGRLVLREDDASIRWEPFAPSSRYDGYRALGAAQCERVDTAPGFSPFIEIAREAADLAAGRGAEPTCDGASALEVQVILETLARSGAETGGNKRLMA